MSSSDMSEALGPVVSSKNLDMTIGFNTEEGRDTIANSSSSSGAQEFSDPTPGSSDSSRPPSAHAPVTVRSLPQPPPLSRPSLPSAEEYSRQHRPPASATQAPLPQSTHSTPAAPRPPGPRAQAATFGLQIAAVADTPLLQLIIQQQQQQHQQQNAQMLALMQSMMAHMSLTPQAPPAQVPTTPQPAVAVRQPGAAARNPWAAPPPPPLSIAAGGCDLCTRQINHICLHSAQANSLFRGSDRLPTSPRPPSAARVFQLPPEQPDGAVD